MTGLYAVRLSDRRQMAAAHVCEIDPRVTRAALMGDPNNHNFKGSGRRSPKRRNACRRADPARRAGCRRNRAASPGSQQRRGRADRSAAAFSSSIAKLIVDLTQHKVPADLLVAFFAQAGGLMAYGPDTMELHRQAAGLSIASSGVRSREALPVERAIAYELVVNARTARALGVDPPAALMARAEEVIE